MKSDGQVLEPIPDDTAASATGRRRASWAARGLAVLAAVWLVFAVLHATLSGRFWLFVIPGLAPPILFALIPAVLLLGAAVARGRRLAVTVMAVGALLVTFPYSGINLAALDGAEKPTAQEIAQGTGAHIVTLNTDYWAQNRVGIMADKRDKGNLFRYLKSLDADVYLLQEHMDRIDNRPVPITDVSDLRAAFPGYEIVAEGTLVTLSRLPVVGHDTIHSVDQPVLQFPAPYGLRTDVLVGGRVMSTYNVHMPVQLLLEESPLKASFYTEIQQREQRRGEEYRALTAAVQANPNPLFIGGDFNTSQAMGDNRDLLAATTDAADSTDNLYPVSWRVGGSLPTLWRNDWALVRNGVTVQDYRFVDPQGNSDHTAQDVRLLVPGGTS